MVPARLLFLSIILFQIQMNSERKHLPQLTTDLSYGQKQMTPLSSHSQSSFKKSMISETLVRQ